MYITTNSQVKKIIEYIFASLSLIFFPISIFIIDLNKSSYKKTALVLSSLLAFIYISGINNFSGDSVSIQYILYIITIKFFWINYLSRKNIKERQKKILFISIFLFFYILLSFIITYFINSNLLEERKVYILLGGNQNSTNFINLSLMILVVSLFSNFRFLTIFLSISLFLISILWQNRTGIVLTPFVVLVHLLTNKKYLISGSFVFFIIINISTLLSFSSRLSSIGLETERSIIFMDAFNEMINGNYFYGGYKVDSSFLIDETKWTHNLILDIYRLSGIPGVIISILLIITTFVKTLKRKENMLLGLFCWFIGFVISMTSVVLESTVFEFILIFILLFNFYFLNKKNSETNLKISF